jgi:hypothetical protein
MNRSSSSRMITAVATMVFLGGVCLGGFSCAKQPPVAATLKPSPDASPRGSVTSAAAPKPVLGASKYPVIVHVVSRDKTVTISSGPKGPLYSVALNDGGAVLVADATGAELEKVQPELYRAIRSYTAVKNNETFLWDGVSQSKSDERLDGVMTADLSAR